MTTEKEWPSDIAADAIAEVFRHERLLEEIEALKSHNASLQKEIVKVRESAYSEGYDAGWDAADGRRPV